MEEGAPVNGRVFGRSGCCCDMCDVSLVSSTALSELHLRNKCRSLGGLLLLGGIRVQDGTLSLLDSLVGATQNAHRVGVELVDLYVATRSGLSHDSHKRRHHTHPSIVPIEGVQCGANHDQGPLAQLRVPIVGGDELVVNVPKVELTQLRADVPEKISAVVR